MVMSGIILKRKSINERIDKGEYIAQYGDDVRKSIIGE